MQALAWKGEEARRERRQWNAEYPEGKRESAERTFFVRNPRLAREVKKRDGYTCQGCRFKGPDEFDQYGERSIEAHHLKAFGERTDNVQSQNVSTALQDVVALCANCHRVVHGKRPALSIAELKALIRRKRA
jgi:5-methylcytosine-specific restriction protein A